MAKDNNKQFTYYEGKLIIELGGSSKPNAQFFKSIFEDQENIENVYSAFGTVVHDIVLMNKRANYIPCPKLTDYDIMSRERRVDEKGNSTICVEQYNCIQDLLERLALSEDKNVVLFRDVIDKNVKGAVEEEIRIDKIFVKNSFAYLIRGKLDCYAFLPEENRVVLFDLKTVNLKEEGKVATTVSNYLSNMMHYSALLFSKFPEIQTVERCIIWMSSKDRCHCGDVWAEVLPPITRQECSEQMNERLTKMDAYLTQEYLKKKGAMPSTSNIVKVKGSKPMDFTPVYADGGEDTMIVDAVTKISKRLSKITEGITQQEKEELRVYMATYISLMGYEHQARLDSYTKESVFGSFYIAMKNKWDLTGRYPDAYITSFSGNVCAPSPSYHLIAKTLVKHGYGYTVLFLSKDDLSTVVDGKEIPGQIIEKRMFDHITGSTTLKFKECVSQIDLDRISKMKFFQTDYVYLCFYKDDKSWVWGTLFTIERLTEGNKSLILNKSRGTWTNSSKSAWATFPTEMMKKCAIKLGYEQSCLRDRVPDCISIESIINL